MDSNNNASAGAALVGFIGVLFLIGFTVNVWSRPEAPVTVAPVTAIEKPKDGWTQWEELFEPKLTQKYHLKFVDVYDKADWWKVLYVTADNKKCDAKFYSYANDPWLEETTNCIKLVDAPVG